jgi:H+/Cl- antiporter ClcA
VTSPPPQSELSDEQAVATMTSKAYQTLLVSVSVVGVVVSLVAWVFLELTHQLQRELFTHLPNALGYSHGPPDWWYLVVLAIGGLLVALAILRMPGGGGHIPADGLAVGSPESPRVLPGIALAGAATIGFGLVLGPEAPLIALGAGTALVMIVLTRREMPQQAALVVVAAGSFSAVSFIFTSPLVAAVLLIEATAIGGPRLRVVLVPGLLAAGIGTLVSVGLGSFTGLSTSAYALGKLSLATFGHPTLVEFGWTIALAAVIAVVTVFVLRGGKLTHRVVTQRRMLALLPVIGLIIAALGIGFAHATGKSIDNVLFSGQDQLPGLVSQAGAWSVGTMALLILCKGVGYLLSLGSFRGGPTFPALFLGAAGGIMASHLPGFPEQAGIAVGMGAAVVAVLRLPLSSVVLATLLTTDAGANVEPLIIVGVVVAYVTTLAASERIALPRARESGVPVPARSPSAADGGAHASGTSARIGPPTEPL